MIINYKEIFSTNAIQKNNGTLKPWLVSIDGLAYKKVKGENYVIPVINTATGLQFEISKKIVLGFKVAMCSHHKNYSGAKKLAKYINNK